MGKSILIIDDDRDFRTALKLVFECHDYRTHEACNGKEGIESYRRTPTDIVLTDIYMPGKDGLETIRELKKEFPETKIIAMSGGNKGNGDFIQVARHLGAIHCIKKPFDPDELIRLVNLTLEGDGAEGATL